MGVYVCVCVCWGGLEEGVFTMGAGREVSLPPWPLGWHSGSPSVSLGRVCVCVCVLQGGATV